MYIINPLDNKKIYLKENKAKKILKRYIKCFLGGSLEEKLTEIKRIIKLGETKPSNFRYEILSIAQGASSRDVIRAYKKKVLKVHPDKYAGGKEQIRANFVKAFQILSNAKDFLITQLSEAQRDKEKRKSIKIE